MNDLNIFAEPAEAQTGRQGRRAQRTARKAQRRRRVTGRAAVLFALAFLVAVVGGGGLLGYVKLHDIMVPPDYSGQGSGEVIVQIRDGDTVGQMGLRLEQHRVVKSSRAFVKVAQTEPRASTIQPGFYQMRLRMASTAAMALLLDPKSRSGNQMTVPEGLRVTQVVAQLSKKTGIPQEDFQKALRTPSQLGLPTYAKGKVEGYLFPGRYDLNPNATAKEILVSMVERFKNEAEDMDLENLAAQAKLRPDQVVTMASMIQSESGKAEDMRPISAVIHNRLNHKPTPMYLKFDSTTLYGLGKYGIVASSKDITSASPYNTYNHPGLPPGAISNPGRKAIQAALNPAKVRWLFFVTTDPKNKVTEFAADEKTFEKLRNKLNRYLAAQGGS